MWQNSLKFKSLKQNVLQLSLHLIDCICWQRPFWVSIYVLYILFKNNSYKIVTNKRFILFQATKEFIEKVNAKFRRKLGPVTWSMAVRFLFARKFDVARALALFEQHELTRQREGLTRFDPTSEPLHSELLTGKFTVLVSFFLLISLYYLFCYTMKDNGRIIRQIRPCRCTTSGV